MKPYPVLFFFILAGITTGCKVASFKQDTSRCNRYGTFQDYSHIDGCTYLLVLDNGLKLLPSSINDPTFSPGNGMRVKFGYEPLETNVSLCMAEDLIVDITCIERLVPVVDECVDTDDPERIPFLARAIKLHKPDKVWKYRYRTDGWMYLFEGKMIYLYDCQGTLICESEASELEQCAQLSDPGTTQQLIWERE